MAYDMLQINLLSRSYSWAERTQQIMLYAGHMPPFSAPLIDNWLAANGIIMGKTTLMELSGGVTSISPNK